MKIVAYLRVSTAGQADGLGLEVQEAAIREWARKHRHRVVAVESDVGSGANSVDDRPALARALGRLAAGEAAALVVYRLDRLARDVVLQETILADLHRVGLELHSTFAAEDENLIHSPEDPTRQLVRQILGAVADYERQVIRLRLRAGRARKTAAGGYGGGAPPFGWRAEGRELVAVPSEQLTLRTIRKLRDQGMSLRAIGRWLDENGHPPRAATKWHPTSLRNVLDRAERGVSRRPAIGSGTRPKKTEEVLSRMS